MLFSRATFFKFSLLGLLNLLMKCELDFDLQECLSFTE